MLAISSKANDNKNQKNISSAGRAGGIQSAAPKSKAKIRSLFISCCSCFCWKIFSAIHRRPYGTPILSVCWYWALISLFFRLPPDMISFIIDYNDLFVYCSLYYTVYLSLLSFFLLMVLPAADVVMYTVGYMVCVCVSCDFTASNSFFFRSFFFSLFSRFSPLISFWFWHCRLYSILADNKKK